MLKQLLKKIIVFLITWETRLVLRKYKPKIIAVTGSVGKTTTKDTIFTALSSSFYIRKSEKSFNSEIGIPLTVLGCPNAWYNVREWLGNLFEGLLLIVLKNHYPKWLVLEIGADRPNDIRRVAAWVRPDITVFTQFSDVPVHVEFFLSPEAVVEEKLYLLRSLKDDGTLIVNADDEKMKSLRTAGAQRILSFGFDEHADVSASHISYLYAGGALKGMSFRINYDGKSVPVSVERCVGRQYVYAYTAALAVGISERVSILSMMNALKAYTPPPGRMRLIDGMKSSVIIDDSYNSSPIALRGALKTLSELEARGKKIVILGDMLELGSFSSEAHRAVGEQAAESANTLVTVGIRARDIARGAHKAGMYKRNIIECNDAYEAGEKAKELVAEGDIILVKGSQGMRMERVIEAIMREPERKRELLVRQEDEWLWKS
jgi:UDP-N-acetylmuramoyl-tripeptide--D-alanyl-D-alanine ligase